MITDEVVLTFYKQIKNWICNVRKKTEVSL
jgi:hypothetical protein